LRLIIFGLLFYGEKSKTKTPSREKILREFFPGYNESTPFEKKEVAGMFIHGKYLKRKFPWGIGCQHL